MHTEATKEKIRQAKMWHTVSAEARIKMSNSKKWKKLSEEHIKNLCIARRKMWKRIFSEQARINISNWQKWKKLSEEHKEKIRQAMMGNTYNTWKKRQPLSENTKSKISKATKWKQRWRWIECHNRKWGLTEINTLARCYIEATERRVNVFKRDNYTCQRCKIRWWRLEAHHIENFSSKCELRYNTNNWIALCKNCHKMFHSIYGIKNNSKTQLSSFITLPI